MRFGEPSSPAYEFQAFPGFRYHPETGEGQIFQNEAEVPEGWTNDPYAHIKDKAPPLPVPAPPGSDTFVMPAFDDRAGLAAALKSKDIKFNPNWSTQRMYDTLVDFLKTL